MTEHRYPRRGLMADYLRAGAGFVLTAGPAAALPGEGLAAPVLALLAGLFAVFGARTALRQASRVVADGDGLSVQGPLGRTLRWRDMTELRLRYFSTRRDRAAGWMQLTVGAPGGAIRLDSTIEGFPEIVRRAAGAARANRLALTRATVDNLRSFGVTLE